MNKPVKLLIVVQDFYQAGAQRFAYEADRALNKSIFETTILCLRNLKQNIHFDDYYYTKHLELGTKIYFLDAVMFKYDKPFFKRVIKKMFFNPVTALFMGKHVESKILSLINENEEKKKNLNLFLQRFSAISWMGEYTVTYVLDYLDKLIFSKSIIHLMNAKFQNVSVYHRYPKNIHYTFMSGFDDEDQVNYELSDFKDYKYILFPWSFKIEKSSEEFKFINKPKKKIGIFTRLDQMKPLHPFFYAFHLLLDKIPETELHVFGAGDPVVSGMQRLVNDIGITNRVFFRGHQRNIKQTAVNENLDLVWFQGYKNKPAGYAGFDICITGIPQLFWDFYYSSGETKPKNAVYPHYRNLNLFVNESFNLLTNEREARDLSSKQMNDVIQNRDIEDHIHILEDAVLQLSKKEIA